MLAQIRERLDTLAAPSRFLDGLIVLYLLGHKTKSIHTWVLDDQRSNILCMQYEKPIEERKLAQVRSIHREDGREMIYDEYEGVYLQFVSRSVPRVTENINDAVSVIQRAHPDITGWSINSKGYAMLWNESTTKRLIGQNNIPAVALIDAILTIHTDKANTRERSDSTESNGAS